MEPAPVSNGIDKMDPLKSFLNGTRNSIRSNASSIANNKATGSLNTLLARKTLPSSIVTTGGQFSISKRSATNPAALQIRQSFEALIKANPIPLPTTTNTVGNPTSKHTFTNHHPSSLLPKSITATEMNHRNNNKTAARKEQQQAVPAPVYEQVSRFGRTRVKPVLPTILPSNDDDVALMDEDKDELEGVEVEVEAAKQDNVGTIDLDAKSLDGGMEVDSEVTQTQKDEENDEGEEKQQQQVEQKLKSSSGGSTKEMKMFQRRKSSIIRPISIDTIDKGNLQMNMMMMENDTTTIGDAGGSVTLAAAAVAAGAAAAALVPSSAEKEKKEKTQAAPVVGSAQKTSSAKTKAATPKTATKLSSTTGKKRKSTAAEQASLEEQKDQQPAPPPTAPVLASYTVVIANKNKVYGCSKCRFNPRGCARCRTDGTKPPPRGKKYNLLLAQQMTGGGGVDGGAVLGAAAATKEKKDKGPAKPSRRRVGPEVVSQRQQQQEQKPVVEVEEKKEKETVVVEKKEEKEDKREKEERREKEEAPKAKKPRRQSSTPKTAGGGNTKAKTIPSPVVVDDDGQQPAPAPPPQQPHMASSPSFPKVEGVPEQVLKEMIKGKWRKYGKCGLCVNCLKPTAKKGCMAQRALRDVGLLAHTAKSLAGASKRRGGVHDHLGANGGGGGGGSMSSTKKDIGGKKRRKVDGGGDDNNETVDKDGWTVRQVEALQRAWVEISPTVPNFWALVAKRVRGKSASECFAKHFSRHLTPPHKKAPAATMKKLLEAAKESHQKGGDGSGGGGGAPAVSGLTGGASKLAMQNAVRKHARQLRMQQQAEGAAVGGAGGGISKHELMEVLEEQRQKHRYIDQILQKRRGKALGAVPQHIVARVAPAAAAMTRRIEAADAGREVREALASMQEEEEKTETVLSQEDADYYWSDPE